MTRHKIQEKIKGSLKPRIHPLGKINECTFSHLFPNRSPQWADPLFDLVQILCSIPDATLPLLWTWNKIEFSRIQVNLFIILTTSVVFTPQEKSVTLSTRPTDNLRLNVHIFLFLKSCDQFFCRLVISAPVRQALHLISGTSNEACMATKALLQF